MRLPRDIGKAIKEGWMRVLHTCSIREIVDSHDVEVLQWVFDNKEWNTCKILEMGEYFCRQDLIDWIITNDPAFDWDELRVAPLMTRTGRKKPLLDSEIDRYPSESALVDAAAQGQLDLVKEIQSAFSVFAVKKAAAAGRVDTLRLLLRTEWGVFKSLLVTAMERAAVNGRVNVMEYLYAQYCRDESFGYMENVLKLAALACQSDAVTFLLRHDPSPIKVFNVTARLFYDNQTDALEVICARCNANDLLGLFRASLDGFRCDSVLEAAYAVCSESTFNEAVNLVLPELPVATERNREAIDFLRNMARSSTSG
ncbi:hypothetical protein PI124_g9364 [Phytophthora idaei]|nr:hypothetical protein PI126_g16971 [Phytophthora idaei]KAG3245905.1 hypothetical protein PI124_g9364 [Phytophthora idaei]